MVEADEPVEKERSSGGQADKAGVGEMEGDGEEFLVVEGETDARLGVDGAGLANMVASVEGDR